MNVPDLNYHDRHQPYMAAVAAALTAAGFPNDGGNAEPNDPRDGFVDLDLEQLKALHGQPIWPDDKQVAVCWQEERGWWLLTIADPTRSNGRFTYELNIATIASPSTVAAAVVEKAKLTIEIPADDHPDVEFPAHEFEDEDPQFEAALLHYA